MKISAKTALTSAIAAVALSAGLAQANPWGYNYKSADYTNSFNRMYQTDVTIDKSRQINKDTRLNYHRDNSVRTLVNKNYALDYKLDYRKDDIKANQKMNQLRKYSSAVNQNAANVGSASGHSMKQKQGGTSVGSLVSEKHTSARKGHNLWSPTVTGNYGNVAKGNMYGSQIGANQTGLQGGNVTNLQANAQHQSAASSVGSSDRVSNTATK